MINVAGLSQSAAIHTSKHIHCKHQSQHVGKQHKIYLHAEIDAIIRAKEQHIHKLFISRIGKSNQYLNAKPCSICAKAISLYGITHVEHT